jgi:hypothetical protein
MGDNANKPAEALPSYEESQETLVQQAGQQQQAMAAATTAAAAPQEQPPAYSASVKLPTYDKAIGIDPGATTASDDEPAYNVTDNPHPHHHHHHPRLTSEFIRRLILIENGESNEQIDRARLGNDWQFILYFLLAFLFNWVGLFATFCCSTTAAARYGGLSGFGLSLVKWITMLRYNPDYWRQLTEANSLDGNNFESQNINANAFIYLFMFIGLLLFFKGAMTWCRFRHLQAPIRPVSERVIQREV